MIFVFISGKLDDELSLTVYQCDNASRSLLTKFQLSIDVDTFYSSFWLDGQWYVYERFMCDYSYLQDISVSVND